MNTRIPLIIRRRKFQFSLLLIMVLVLGAVVWRVWFAKSDSGAWRYQMGDTIVHAGTVSEADVPIYLNSPATVIPNASVTVTSRIDGQLDKLFFTEGQEVKAGQLLAQLDDREYQASLAQYQGSLAEHQAQLRSAELILARYRKLYAQDSLSRQDLDTQLATVGQYRGLVQQDQAQIASAKVNIGYAKITAPISGRVGLRLVDVGNMVRSSDSNGLVTITQMQPAAATFSVPQQYIRQITQQLHHGLALPAIALDQDNQTSLAKGEVRFISNSIDTTTGSIELKALFDNKENILYSNQFINVRLQIALLKQATVVPAAAVQLSNDGEFVFTVDAEHKVKRRAVTTGPLDGEDKQVILSGVKLGDRVITEGLDRLHDGDKVTIADATSESTTQTTKTGYQANQATGL